MKVQVVVGGQYGSEAKGHVTDRLVRRAHAKGERVYNVRVAGPNAGHTVYDKDGHPWPLRQVPVGAVYAATHLVVAPGSEIDPVVLLSEIDGLESAGFEIRGRMYVDQEATVLDSEHKTAEKVDDLVNRIGSTGKGIGAARADRIMRRADRVYDDEPLLMALAQRGVTVTDTTHLYGGSQTIIIEGTQGYGLGLHAGHYPQCTSSDCRAVDFLAMAGISPWSIDPADFEVWVVFRTHPIRVAGNSGPMYAETNWSTLGLPEEKTTVTKKIRRVGHWDEDLARAALLANGDTSQQVGGPFTRVRVALTMIDQVEPVLRDKEADDVTVDPILNNLLVGQLRRFEHSLGRRIDMVTTGPKTGIWL